MPQTMTFDFISDVSCPWCIVGLRGLEIALEKLSDTIEPAITFHPFELNPHMPPGGQDIGEHVAEKYGSTPEQRKANGAMIRQLDRRIGDVLKIPAASSRIKKALSMLPGPLRAFRRARG